MYHLIMKSLWTIMLVTAVSLSSLPAMADSQKEEVAALMKADGAWFAKSKDGAAFIGFTDPDFTFYPPNAPFMSDKKQMIKYWDAIVKTPGLELVWGPDGAVVAKSGDLGYTYGRYRLTTKSKDGSPTVAKGKYVTVLRKQESGEWRPLVDIFNADK